MAMENEEVGKMENRHRETN
ncbi:hypothetical protein CCACVL1_29340 [Corchorus capsularis]|uniref:Uncharacterized protein n=1 Tax=Corchorus capsularis TaxID=210143 RepID=A0A1R3G2A2_COCAP|nr:hypothetical protein CCACVL1_29340 [Corchorus capsularis]